MDVTECIAKMSITVLQITLLLFLMVYGRIKHDGIQIKNILWLSV